MALSELCVGMGENDKFGGVFAKAGWARRLATRHSSAGLGGLM